MIANWLLDLPQAISHEICMHGPKSRALHPFTKFALTAPLVIFPSVSIICDILILRFLSQIVSNKQNGNSNGQHTTTKLAVPRLGSFCRSNNEDNDSFCRSPIHQQYLHVPVRATVASALFAVPYAAIAFGVAAVANNDFTGEVFIIACAIIMVSIRPSLTVAITYRHDQVLIHFNNYGTADLPAETRA